MMNRKLTTHQSILGARAYSHNASRRAHQLSGPKRVRVMHGPFELHPEVLAEYARREALSCSGCGFIICSKRGPCSPVFTSPALQQPSARALDNLPAEPSPAGGRFKVGDRVRVVGNSSDNPSGVHCLEIGGEGTVLSINLREDTIRVHGPGGDGFTYSQDVLRRDLEPAPPVSEAPAVESDEALLKRCGFATLGNERVGDATHRARNGAYLGQSERPERIGQWFANYPTDGRPNAYAPTLLQAACAALGIDLECGDGVASAMHCKPGGDLLVLVSARDNIRDIEMAARAALEAWSRREPAQ